MNAPGALAGFIGAVPEGGREQTVWTPEFILDRVDLVFPEGWFDPYQSEGSPATRRSAFKAPEGFDAHQDHWATNNFANPPYDDLEAALAAARRAPESIQLVPVRPHRAWFCANVAGAAVAYLKPVTFLDSRTGKPYVTKCKRTGKATVSQFPAPLCLVYRGERVDLFRSAFADISHHTQESF